MVARGEIGLFILNLAREPSPDSVPDELFYIAIWATLLCTIVGPLTVGLIVNSLKANGKYLPAEWGPVVNTVNVSGADHAAMSESSAIRTANATEVDSPVNRISAASAKPARKKTISPGQKMLLAVRPSM